MMLAGEVWAGGWNWEYVFTLNVVLVLFATAYKLLLVPLSLAVLIDLLYTCDIGVLQCLCKWIQNTEFATIASRMKRE